MKKFCAAVLALSVYVMAVGASCAIFATVGNGDIVSSERSVSSFDKVSSGGSADVRYYASDHYRVVVSADSNLIDFVTTKIKNNTLEIGQKSGSYAFTKLLVDVYCPVITGVSLSGSGSFTGQDPIAAPVFDARVSGSGNIGGTIACNTFSASISGSGKISIEGSSDTSDVSISGSGKFNGDQFSINKATVQISGSGKANMHVTGSLKAKITGSGEICYHGNPQVDSSISGSGKIKKL